MDKKKYTVSIDVPDGYKLIDKGNNHYEVVKKEQSLPKTWKEFCFIHSIKAGEIYIAPDSLLLTTTNRERDVETDRNLLPDKKTAEAFIALMQLIQLKKCYNGDWEPDWKEHENPKFVICSYREELHPTIISDTNMILAFKTEELRDKFLENFRDLIEIAKPLI